MRTTRSKLAYLAMTALLLAAAFVVRQLDPAIVVRLRMLAFDAYHQLAPRAYDPAFAVRIVDIDDESIKRLGQWPWPRTQLARMVSRLGELGAAVVAFDFVMSETDRHTPAEFLKSLPDDPALAAYTARIKALPGNDQALAGAIAQVPVVMGFIAVPDGVGAPPRLRAAMTIDGDNPRQFVPAYKGAITSIEPLEAAAAGSGALNWVPEHDQVLRRLPLLVHVGDRLYPSLAVEALRVAQGLPGLTVTSSGAPGAPSFGRKTGIVRVTIGDVVAPTAASGELWLHYTPREPRRFIPAHAVLDGTASRQDIEGRVILLGTSSAGLFDLRTTPLDASVPGVEIQAQAIEQMMRGTYLRRPDYATGAELSFLMLAGAALAWLVYRSGALSGALFGALGLTTSLATSWWAYRAHGWLLDPVYPALVLTALYVLTTVFVYLRTEVERNSVRNAFAHYLAPTLVEELARDPRKLKLGGELRRVTLFRSDLAGFTPLSERLAPDELIELMNAYLSAMTDIIIEHTGFVDKYIGDAIDGVFGAPYDDGDQALHAVRAALACQARLREMNAAGVPALRGHSLRQRIGLHTGEGLVGNIGSHQRFNYTVLGDVANLASRLEGANKIYGTNMIASEATVLLAGPGVFWRELDVIQVVGRATPVRIFEPLAMAGSQTGGQEAIAAAYARGLRLWRSKEFAGAVASFAEFSEADPPSRMFLARAERLAADPPADTWQPVNVLDSK